jgi:hypothetical protein
MAAPNRKNPRSLLNLISLIFKWPHNNHSRQPTKLCASNNIITYTLVVSYNHIIRSLFADSRFYLSGVDLRKPFHRVAKYPVPLSPPPVLP